MNSFRSFNPYAAGNSPRVFLSARRDMQIRDITTSSAGKKYNPDWAKK